MSSFIMPYETLDEIHMRLASTVVRYKGELVLVNDKMDQEGENFYLYIAKGPGDRAEKVLFDESFDLSPLPPRYVNYQGKSYWACRLANRMYQQGANSKNTFLTPVGSTRRLGQGGFTLITAYTSPVFTTHFSAALGETLKSQYDQYLTTQGMALNDHLAVGFGLTEDDKPVGFFVEYKGIIMGTLVPDGDSFKIVTDNESISFNPWFKAKLDSAGIKY